MFVYIFSHHMGLSSLELYAAPFPTGGTWSRQLHSLAEWVAYLAGVDFSGNERNKLI